MTQQSFIKDLESLANLLRARHWQLATAESCTGGWIAKSLTDLPGSSDWFERGVVTYSNRSKSEMLRVSETLIEREGAVSEAVARDMADGIRSRAGVAVGLSVTGIAGPGGGSADKPVGTVFFGWSVTGCETRTMRQQFDGGRNEIRDAAASFSVAELARMLAALGERS